MRLMKFGGTSVGDPARITNLCDIVRGALPLKPVVVVSAASRVTDMLLTAAREAAAGRPSSEAIEARAQSLLAAFSIDPSLIADELSALRRTLDAIAVFRHASPEALDLVASFGERVSARAIAATLRLHGVNAVARDAWEIGMITDSNFTAAEPLPEASESLRASVCALVAEGTVPVITGFIGKTVDGRVTTLGRGGSDYTAAILGAAVGSDEIEIWTDVPGVMSSDPRVVSEAHTIPALSFNQAAELAYFGAKVLHPKTILPAVRSGIPVRVKNTFEPAHPGTVITAGGAVGVEGARAIAHKKGIAVVSVVSSRMLLAHGFLARIFEVFARHQVVVDLVSTSEVSVSCTVDREDGLDAACDELRGFGEVTVSRGRALVCVVTSGSARVREILPQSFAALAAEGLSVELISMGASTINLSVVLPEAQVERAVRTLHRALFAEVAQ